MEKCERRAVMDQDRPSSGGLCNPIPIISYRAAPRRPFELLTVISRRPNSLPTEVGFYSKKHITILSCRTWQNLGTRLSNVSFPDWRIGKVSPWICSLEYLSRAASSISTWFIPWAPRNGVPKNTRPVVQENISGHSCGRLRAASNA